MHGLLCRNSFILLISAPAHRDAGALIVQSNQSFDDRVQHSVCKSKLLKGAKWEDNLAKDVAEGAGMYSGEIMREWGTGVLVMEAIR